MRLETLGTRPISGRPRRSSGRSGAILDLSLAQSGYLGRSSKSSVWRFFARSGRAVLKLLRRKYIDHAQLLINVNGRASLEQLENGKDG